MTKGILKSSKTKKRLYDQFLKSKSYEHDLIAKTAINYLNRLNKQQSRNITQR